MSEPPAAGVTLTPLLDADVQTLFAWINDRELVEQSAPFRQISIGEHVAWFNAIRTRDDVRIFGIRERSGRLIGTCQLHSIHPIHRSAELQIRIGEPRDIGRGYGSAAVRALLRVAFAELGLHRVHLHVLASNTRAIRAYRRCGFREEGLQREAACIGGRFQDVVLMGILRTEWGVRSDSA